MAKRPEYTQYSVYSKLDPSSGEFDIPSYERDIRNIINNAVKSALPKDAFFQLGDKALSQNGQVRWDIYVHKEDEAVVGQALSQIREELTFKDVNGKKGTDEKYSVLNAGTVSADKASALRDYERSLSLQESETSKFNKGALMKVVGLLTAVVDITRRILSSVLNFSVQTNKDMITANNLGLSYEAVRSYRHTETAHGLKAGTITDALADIQAKFGNITSLDEKSLEALAVVMGGKIEDMAKMGIGASNPDAILGAILDDFNAKANAGYNSIGQYVGEQQARRELYSYLLKVSPQIADIFATMQNEQHNINSLFRNQADTFEEWKNLLPTSRGDNATPMNYNVTATLGQEWNVVQDMVKQIKESLFLSIAPALLSILRRLSNIRLGLSETENRRLNEQNKLANETEISNVKKQMALIKGSWATANQAEKDYYSALSDYLDELTKANASKGNIDYVVRTPEEIRVMANSISKRNANTNDSTSVTVNKDGSVTVSGMAGVTVDDIKGVLASYPNIVDTVQAKSDYEASVIKANQDIIKNNVKIEDEAKASAEKEIEQLGKNRLEERKATAKAYADDKVLKDKNSPYYMNAWKRTFNPVETSLALRLAEAESFFGVTFEGKSLQEKINWAISQRYMAYNPASNVKLIPDINWGNSDSLVSAKEKESIRNNALASAEARKQDLLEFKEDDFYWWIYDLNTAKFNPHISGKKLDDLIASSITGNRFASTFVLGQENWQSKIPSTYTGGGVVTGYNDTSNGTVEHKIVLEIDDNGKKQSVVLGSWLGMTGYEGVLGTVNVSKENGSTDYTLSLGDSASEQKK